jgi:hypothetical protein
MGDWNHFKVTRKEKACDKIQHTLIIIIITTTTTAATQSSVSSIQLPPSLLIIHQSSSCSSTPPPVSYNFPHEILSRGFPIKILYTFLASRIINTLLTYRGLLYSSVILTLKLRWVVNSMLVRLLSCLLRYLSTTVRSTEVVNNYRSVQGRVCGGETIRLLKEKESGGGGRGYLTYRIIKQIRNLK